MRTALYLRVSLDKSGEGLGIERQREDCRKLAEQRGWTVVYEIEETIRAPVLAPVPVSNSCFISWRGGRLPR
jgi:hypothetical protein